MIILSPLHEKLPALTALVQGVCKRFTHKMVDEQWIRLQELHDKHLLPVLGPLLGNGSDGDSRRRLLQRRDLFSNEGERYGLK